MIRLRGHHLLCLLGFQGMGYSPEFVAHMTDVHQHLRNSPDTEILLVAGPDDLCERFPDDQPNHCKDANIDERDRSVLQKIGVQAGDKVTWRDLQQRIKGRLEPRDIPNLCSTCPWRSYGVCEEGVANANAGRNLRHVPLKGYIPPRH